MAVTLNTVHAYPSGDIVWIAGRTGGAIAIAEALGPRSYICVWEDGELVAEWIRQPTPGPGIWESRRIQP